MLTLDRAAPHVNGRRHDPLGAEPLEGENAAYDVDDRVDRPNFVQMHLLDRHLMNPCLGLGQPRKQPIRPGLGLVTESGPVHELPNTR